PDVESQDGSDTSPDTELDTFDEEPCEGVRCPGEWTHEPEGFVVFNTRHFEAESEDGWDDRGSFSIVSDDSGRSGTSTAGQKTFARGSVSGAGISSLWKPENHEQFRDLYVATYMKVSSNFRQDSSGVTKIWYNRGLSSDYTHPNNASQQHTHIYGGALRPSLLSRHHGGDVERKSGSQSLPRNEWFLVEMLIRSSSGDAGGGASEENGEMWVWIDAELALHWEDVRTHRSGSEQWWESVELNTIWGGGGNRMNSWEVIASEQDGEFISGAFTYAGGTQFSGEVISFSNGRHGWYNPAFHLNSLAIDGPNLNFVPSVIVNLSGVSVNFTPGATVQTDTGDYRDLKARVIQQNGNELELMVYEGDMNRAVGEVLTQTEGGITATIDSWADWDPEVGMSFTGRQSGATATIGEVVHAGAAWWRFDDHRISLGNLPEGYTP
ncbi:MAG: hypothetical protein ACNA8W_21290, partial [Bradymonadaceae bacterium]